MFLGSLSRGHSVTAVQCGRWHYYFILLITPVIVLKFSLTSLYRSSALSPHEVQVECYSVLSPCGGSQVPAATTLGCGEEHEVGLSPRLVSGPQGSWWQSGPLLASNKPCPPAPVGRKDGDSGQRGLPRLQALRSSLWRWPWGILSAVTIRLGDRHRLSDWFGARAWGGLHRLKRCLWFGSVLV